MLEIFEDLNSNRLYLSSQKQRENRCPVFTSSIKREMRKFDVVIVRCSDGKEIPYAKKRDARTKLLFCQSQPIAFLPSSSSSLSLLKLPNISIVVKLFARSSFSNVG